MINLVNIEKVYKTKFDDITVLRGLNLKIEKNEIIAIIGSSGSGKSTLLNIIGGMEVCTKGSYQFLKRNMNTINDKERSKIRNTEVSFIHQDFALINEISILDNVILPLKIRRLKKNEMKELALSSLENVGLKGLEKKKPYELSGGQRQRVAIARALTQNTCIILADEPTGNLDKKTSEDIMNLFLALNKKQKTIIIVTHDIEIAKKCDKIFEMIDGSLKIRDIKIS